MVGALGPVGAEPLPGLLGGVEGAGDEPPPEEGGAHQPGAAPEGAPIIAMRAALRPVAQSFFVSMEVVSLGGRVGVPVGRASTGVSGSCRDSYGTPEAPYMVLRGSVKAGSGAGSGTGARLRRRHKLLLRLDLEALAALGLKLLDELLGHLRGLVAVVAAVVDPHLLVEDHDGRPALDGPVVGDRRLALDAVLEAAPVEAVLLDGFLDVGIVISISEGT